MGLSEQKPKIQKPMNLPTPTPDQVREFATIYAEEFGVILSQSQAWETATTTLQLFYLGTYGLKTKAPATTASTPASLQTKT